MTADIRVSGGAAGEGWCFEVTVSEGGSSTRHRVTFTKADLASLGGGRLGPEELVRRAFEFLLQREPKESILSEFALPVISRYFPDFESQFRR